MLRVVKYALLVCFALLLAAVQAIAAEAPAIKVGTLKFGTVNWELKVISDGLDEKHGFKLTRVDFADKDATSIALQSGEVDVIVTDWIWVAMQRKLGHNFTFVPFSRSVGAVMADPAKGIKTVADLAGRSIGVAGGPSDKSWVLLQAYARQTADLELKDKADVQFAAPPLLNELVQRAKLDAVLNFWHFNARLKGKGFVPVISIRDILPDLGLEADPPLLGWVFSEQWAAANPELAKGLIDASYEAKALLKSDDALWEKLRPIMDAEDDATFQALRDGYRDGIPGRYERKDIAAAESAFAVMRAADPGSVGNLEALPEGTFWPGYLK
ncbi:ABC transporter substrate-binding protein [Dongia deserti]|uniref:ABC transporter substrate-binding protein n=1 Tax=Dongia deserti TaxID=2268030 RepID=UPI000E653B48|nr:ABC transporter substrate-binding protein [Dongia deserti]